MGCFCSHTTAYTDAHARTHTKTAQSAPTYAHLGEIRWYFWWPKWHWAKYFCVFQTFSLLV